MDVKHLFLGLATFFSVYMRVYWRCQSIDMYSRQGKWEWKRERTDF